MNTYARIRAGVVVASALALCLSARADELLPPLSPSAAGVGDAKPTGACDLPAAGPLRRVRLVVRDTPRPDVGPYTVSLPGYATDPADPSQDSYRPYLIEAEGGDTIRIDLDNRLDPQKPDSLINLHTHGLVVSPRPDFPCGLPGDYIFDQLAPGDSFRYRIDIPGTVKGIGGSGTHPFPAGLYWFHSHLHGSSKNQVQAGQSGIIAVGPPPTASATEAEPTAAIRAATTPRYLVLRDIQLSVPQGETPDRPLPKGVQGTWLHDDDYDTQACRKEVDPTVREGRGFCTHAISDSGTPAKDLVWLFTVNGQVDPTITVASGQTQLWRVANVSATVAYTLDLTDSAGAERDLHLLTLDGVVAGTRDPNGSSKRHPSVATRRILLMPASRAEILIDNTNSAASDEVLTLHTNGLETGGANQRDLNDPSKPASKSDYVGDPWPALALATVVLKGRSPPSHLPELLAASYDRGAEAQRLLSAEASAATAPPPAHCIALPDKNHRRVITFAQDDSTFWLGSDVVDPTGTPVSGPADSRLIAPRPFEHAIPPQADRHICARLGDQEVWELVNTTNELHNFHIHQTKFRLARAGDPGLPPGFKDAIQDPAGIIKSQVPEFGAAAGVDGVDVWHDTIPVPPGRFDGTKLTTPGRTFVSIPFKDAVQVGTFVFHCHILEHEDKGMMAVVEVYDPAHPTVSRQGADAGPPSGPHRLAAFCGKTDPDLDLFSERQAAAAPEPWFHHVAARLGFAR